MLMMNICDGTREDPVANIPGEYQEIYTECWNGDPDKRPKLVDILNRLRKMGASEGPPKEPSKPLKLTVKVLQLFVYGNILRI